MTIEKIFTNDVTKMTYSFKNPLKTRLVDVPVRVPVPPMLAA